jgi:hypothetical protein
MRSLKVHWHPSVAGHAEVIFKLWKAQYKAKNSEEDELVLTVGGSAYDSIKEPSGVPDRPSLLSPKLWGEICKQYNSPQLHAISSACSLASPDQQSNKTCHRPSVMLLQVIYSYIYIFSFSAVSPPSLSMLCVCFIFVKLSKCHVFSYMFKAKKH